LSVPTLDIEDMPEDALRTLEARAAVAGLPMAEYALQVLVATAQRPSREELMAELRSVPIRPARESGADDRQGGAG